MSKHRCNFGVKLVILVKLNDTGSRLFRSEQPHFDFDTNDKIKNKQKGIRQNECLFSLIYSMDVFSIATRCVIFQAELFSRLEKVFRISVI